MKKVLVVLVVIALVPFLTSCAKPMQAVKGTGKGIGSVGEGIARGTMEAGKGTGALVGGTVKATGEALTGSGKQALGTQKGAFEGAGEGLKGTIEEPAKGIVEGVRHIDTGIKESAK